jgi:murein DD-endopeptidase MepM/ murein hydrolase activator NlpD
MASISFYNIGSNYILLAIAAGGFFTIPSRYSYLWALILVPVLSMLILFFRNIPGMDHLPLFSLPFSVISILYLYFLGLRVTPGKLKTTIIQHYSPEINLYTFINNADRLTGFSFFPFRLPFWGEWKISQGYDGKHTHKGDWKSAIDAVIEDDSGKMYSPDPNTLENYFCYNKPVIAPADGIIVEIIDNVDDNEPGIVNTVKNWGNTVIIRHSDHLYTQMSHLKAGSFRKRKGDYVSAGEVIAACGNSGRSPEPHLHFQVQSAPSPGSKTLEYPFSYYLKKDEESYLLRSYTVPAEGDRIINVETDALLKNAFDFQPGMILNFNFTQNNSEKKEARWEVFTDAFNSKYLYCAGSGSYAYFVHDGTMFYFTAFYGDQKSLLFHFYLSAYKIFLGTNREIEITDNYPLHIINRNRVVLWLHDLVAPFHQYLKINYSSRVAWSDSVLSPEKVKLDFRIERSVFSKRSKEGAGNIIISGNKVSEFTLETGKSRIWAQNSDI